jgi:hypothetical protein
MTQSSAILCSTQFDSPECVIARSPKSSAGVRLRASLGIEARAILEAASHASEIP